MSVALALRSWLVALQVLGKKRPDGSALLSVSELRDGIVTFEDPDDAERYGNLLEAEGRLEVHQRTHPCCLSLEEVCPSRQLLDTPHSVCLRAFGSMLGLTPALPHVDVYRG